MSITRDGDEVVFNCDLCPEFVETGESDFLEAVRLAKRDGWGMRKNNKNVWEHFCPTCVEDALRSS